MTNLTDTTGTWQIDPTHTTIGFSVRHAMIAKVRGRFTDFAGSFTLDGGIVHSLLYRQISILTCVYICPIFESERSSGHRD